MPWAGDALGGAFAGIARALDGEAVRRAAVNRGSPGGGATGGGAQSDDGPDAPVAHPGARAEDTTGGGDATGNEDATGGEDAGAGRDGGALGRDAGRASLRRPTIAIDGATAARLIGGGALEHAGGRTARDDAGQPIGVRLRGVSSLGVGLRDGDVVTSINGTPTPTDDDATPVALAALGSGKPMRATVLRDGKSIDVYVEPPAAADPAAPR